MASPDSSKYLTSLLLKPVISVHLLCLGNICRSPMANAVVLNLIQDLDKPKVLVDSSGTGPWHVGQDASQLSKQVWQDAGYKYSHIAKQFDKSFLQKHDLILSMDLSNRENAIKLASSDLDKQKVMMFRSFDPALSQINPQGEQAFLLEMPDPYGLELEAYQTVLVMVEQAAAGFNSWVRS